MAFNAAYTKLNVCGAKYTYVAGRVGMLATTRAGEVCSSILPGPWCRRAQAEAAGPPHCNRARGPLVLLARSCEETMRGACGRTPPEMPELDRTPLTRRAIVSHAITSGGACCLWSNVKRTCRVECKTDPRDLHVPPPSKRTVNAAGAQSGKEATRQWEVLDLPRREA